MELIDAGANHPLFLDQSQSIWLVEKGPVHVFSVWTKDNQESDLRHYLFSAVQGDLLFGIDSPEPGDYCKLVAVGEIGGQLKPVSPQELAIHLNDLHAYQEWAPKLARWVEQVQQSMVVPLSMAAPIHLEGLARFNQEALRTLHLDNRSSLEKEEAENLEDARRGSLEFTDSVRRLFLLFQRNPIEGFARSTDDPLTSACRVVFKALGLPLTTLQRSDPSAAHEDAVQVLADASNIRVRQVALKGRWWRYDCGPLLVFLKDGQTPLALIPEKKGRYQLVDPARGAARLLSEAEASKLEAFAYSFFHPLPRQGSGRWKYIRWAFAGTGRDIAQTLGTSLAIAILGLGIPFLMWPLFDYIIPSASLYFLIQYAAGLCLTGLGLAAFGISQHFSISRIASGVSYRVQSAVMDHLIQLPPAFFRRFASGELAFRALGVDQIRETLNDRVIQTLLSGIFSCCNIVVMFVIHWRLGLVSCALFVLQGVVTGAAFVYYSHRLLRQERVSGEAGTQVYEILSGISKIRVAGKERQAFVRWADRFHREMAGRQGVGRLSVIVAMMDASFPYLLFSVLLLAIHVFAGDHLSVGQFLAFCSVSLSFTLFFAMLGQLSVGMLQVFPLARALKPILEAEPEAREDKAEVGTLSGQIEVVRASFAYEDSGKQVLIDFNFKVEPGQFVALVGPSGGGKSTFLRLLLGFDTPTSGAVYYDGQDLARLKATQVRKQLGVVLQNGQLLPGSILDNIVGSSLLTLDDAWAAAKMCGLDEDVQRMPMGMHTMIGEGMGLSGGQRQRILIARALVRKPKILFFDEATSALDNFTQRVVTESISKLNVSRVVIAHRLSTIQTADFIYVLDKGRVVQRGQYQELVDQPGLFAELARRQMA